MAKRGKGKIINTSSVSEEIADPGASHYCIGKGGTRMLTRSAALELAEYNIQVNSLSPGTIKTALPWYDTPDAQEYLEKFVPAGRFGLPQDVAGAAVFLASDDSDYVTGTTIVIDGGLTTQ
jgi:glucose 1-dehydrogenase